MCRFEQLVFCIKHPLVAIVLREGNKSGPTKKVRTFVRAMVVTGKMIAECKAVVVTLSETIALNSNRAKKGTCFACRKRHQPVALQLP